MVVAVASFSCLKLDKGSGYKYNYDMMVIDSHFTLI